MLSGHASLMNSEDYVLKKWSFRTGCKQTFRARFTNSNVIPMAQFCRTHEADFFCIAFELAHLVLLTMGATGCYRKKTSLT